MSDPALFAGGYTDGVRGREQEPQRAGSHRAAVSRIRCRRPGLEPGYPHEQPERRRPGAPSSTDVPAITKQFGQAPGEGGGIPAAAFHEAQQQLPGKLGIVAVLSEGKFRVGSLGGAAGPKPLIRVFLGYFRRLGFDHKAQCVPQSLSQNRASEAIGGR